MLNRLISCGSEFVVSARKIGHSHNIRIYVVISSVRIEIVLINADNLYLLKYIIHNPKFYQNNLTNIEF